MALSDCQLQVAGRHASLKHMLHYLWVRWVRWKYFVLLARLLERSRARRSSFCWNTAGCVMMNQLLSSD